jgi:1-acyl-sn-glycerol-3-phosphate acyltransferase
LNFNKIKNLSYSLWLTRKYANLIANVPDICKKKNIRMEYAKTLLSQLNLHIHIENSHKIPQEGQYLIFSNHRSVIDPLIIDTVFEHSKIFGLWIAKKELYNSFFLGKAVRHGGCIQLDRENQNRKIFFSEIQDNLEKGCSICIFPEGTRNQTKQNVLPFKKGVNIIASKNKLPLLPIYIQSNASEVLNEALHDSSIEHTIKIVIGDIIEDSKKKNLEALYRTMFDLGK